MPTVQYYALRDLKTLTPFCCSGTFQQTFSPRNFVDVTREGRKAGTQEPSEEQTFPEVSKTADVEAEVGVFQCSNEGCTKVYQRYSALESRMECLSYAPRKPHFFIKKKEFRERVWKQKINIKLSWRGSCSRKPRRNQSTFERIGAEVNKEAWALQ